MSFLFTSSRNLPQNPGGWGVQAWAGAGTAEDRRGADRLPAHSPGRLGNICGAKMKGPGNVNRISKPLVDYIIGGVLF